MSETKLDSSDLARLGIDVIPRLMRAIIVLGGHPNVSNIASATQFRVVKRLAQRPWLVSELAHSLQLSVPTVSVAVDSLVRRGLVERGEAAGDRRAILLRLTPEGVKNYEAAMEQAVGAFCQIVERMPDEDRAALAAGLTAIARALDDVVPVRCNPSSTEIC